MLISALPAVVWAQSELVWITVKNDSKVTANDLHLKFKDGAIEEAVYGTQTKPKKRATLNPPANDLAQWSVKAMDDVVPAGEARTIGYKAKAGPRPQLDTASADTHWTLNGGNLEDSVKTVSVTLSWAFVSGSAFVTFYNPESFDVSVSDVQLYANNDLAQFTLDDFETPSGTLVGGQPTSFMLSPQGSVTLPFGPVLPNAYQLAEGEVAAASEPGSRYSVGSAAVPEPATWILAALAAVAAAARGETSRRPSRSWRCGRLNTARS